jgi:hypothetical protein
VEMKHYDDGWRLVEVNHPVHQSLEDALKNAEPVR